MSPSRGRLYLDHAATSPLRPAVLEEMLGVWHGVAANAASHHAEGRLAARAVSIARARVAALVGTDPGGVIFTSGATEASNLAICGGAAARPSSRRRIVTSPIEHAATRQAAHALALAGWQVRMLPVDGDGRLVPEGLSRLLTPDTAVVSVIAGHNELGTLQPIEALAEAAHRAGAWLHLDAVQAAASLPLAELPWDMLSLSAHKLGGPPGVGALVRRPHVTVRPVLHGGSQEGGLRPGTVPVGLVAGFGKACELALVNRQAATLALASRRDRLARLLLAAVPALRPLGAWATRPEAALPHVAAFLLPGVAGDEIVHALDAAGVAASSASACLAGSRSPTLDALAVSEGTGLLRLSLGWTTDDETIEAAASRIAEALHRLLAATPFQRRTGPLLDAAAGAGIPLGPVHWEAAEAVHTYWLREGCLPGPRQLARLRPGAPALDTLFPDGLATLASWLGVPVPAGGCRSLMG